MGILSFRMDIFTPGFYKKDPSSFRLHGNPFIILTLQAEGYFRHPSAKPHFVRHRTENRSPEIEKSFGAELFMGLYNERKLKDEFPIFHSIIYYVRGSWPTA